MFHRRQGARRARPADDAVAARRRDSRDRRCDLSQRQPVALRGRAPSRAALRARRYTITRDPQVSALAVTRQPITVGSLTVDPMRRTVQLDGRDIEMKSREFDLIDLREELFRLIDIDSRAIEAAALLREWCGSSPIGFSSGKSPRCSAIYASLA